MDKAMLDITRNIVDFEKAEKDAKAVFSADFAFKKQIMDYFNYIKKNCNAIVPNSELLNNGALYFVVHNYAEDNVCHARLLSLFQFYKKDLTPYLYSHISMYDQITATICHRDVRFICDAVPFDDALIFASALSHQESPDGPIQPVLNFIETDSTYTSCLPFDYFRVDVDLGDLERDIDWSAIPFGDGDDENKK